MKNLKSTRLSPLSIFCVIKVMMKVMQFTNGTAMERSLAATTKLFRMPPTWFSKNGTRKRQLENMLPVSDRAPEDFLESYCSVASSMKALVVPQMPPTKKYPPINLGSIFK